MSLVKLEFLKQNKKLHIHFYLFLLFTFIYYSIDQYLANTNNDYQPMFQDIHTCLYYTIVTQFTVGYGDISPKHYIMRYLCSFHILLSFAFTLL